MQSPAWTCHGAPRVLAQTHVQYFRKRRLAFKRSAGPVMLCKNNTNNWYRASPKRKMHNVQSCEPREWRALLACAFRCRRGCAATISVRTTDVPASKLALACAYAHGDLQCLRWAEHHDSTPGWCVYRGPAAPAPPCAAAASPANPSPAPSSMTRLPAKIEG